MKQGVQWPNIPYEEYRSRIDLAKKKLTEQKIDAMILFSPLNWWYYGGFTDPAQMHNLAWRTVLIVCQDRDPIAIADTNFIWTFAHISWVEDVRYHFSQKHPAYTGIRSGEEFYPVLFDALKSAGLDKKTIGLETGAEIATYLSIDEYQMIKEKLPQAKIVNADPVIWSQRMIKTPYEQEIIREGCRRACVCVREAFETIRPGALEKDVHRAFWRKALELDMIESPNHSTWLCFSSNPNESLGGHRWITPAVDRVIKTGDCGHSDCGPTYKMYEMDFQRAFCVGEPPAKTLEYYRIGKEAYYETIDAMKPGVRIGELYDISVRALEKRGFPHGHTISFIGHGEGLANHEPPWIMSAENTIVQPGMVLAVEIGCFDPDGVFFGGMLEDLWLITGTGSENLTRHFTDELYVAEAR
ncbi:MAG: aminopeptidase P family protein [Spirochaetes bacterium]|nr:MAG: aminopeptidase P family protein [Spirochaetota bacterium]